MAIPAQHAFRPQPRFQTRAAVSRPDAGGVRRPDRIRPARLVRHVAGAQGRREVHVGGPTRPADTGQALADAPPGRRHWGGCEYGGSAPGRGSERPGCGQYSSQLALACVHRRAPALRSHPERPGIEPRHAEQTRRRLLGQAGHVGLGYLVAQRGAKRPPHAQAVHSTGRGYELAVPVVGDRRQIHRARVGGIRQGTRRTRMVVVPL